MVATEDNDMLSINNNNCDYDYNERERQVIGLYDQGKSTRDIAKELRMSLRDISIILRKNHVSRGIPFPIVDNDNDNNNNKSPNQKSTQAYNSMYNIIHSYTKHYYSLNQHHLRTSMIKEEEYAFFISPVQSSYRCDFDKSAMLEFYKVWLNGFGLEPTLF
jgi:hypothetical protein